MDEFELQQLQRHPQWGIVLHQYLELSARHREQTADFDGWIPRILEAPEVATEELPGIHGKLIAFGFLKFDIAGRDAGIRYQLTPLGKQGINSSPSTDDEDGPTDARENEELLAFRQ